MLTEREKKVLIGVRKLFKHQCQIGLHTSAQATVLTDNDVIHVSFLTTLEEYNELRRELNDRTTRTTKIPLRDSWPE